MKVGLFFFFNNDFAFTGCDLTDAQEYGDFLVYDESHYAAWERFSGDALVDGRRVDYDYFPRGRVTYRKSDDTFIIYYDKCIEKEIKRLAKNYDGRNVLFALDEHYCCHNCNPDYTFL